MAETKSTEANHGFDKPSGIDNGNGKSQNRATEQQPTSDRIAGFATVDPFEVGAIISGSPEPAINTEPRNTGPGSDGNSGSDRPIKRGPGRPRKNPLPDTIGRTENPATTRIQISDTNFANLESLLYSIHLMGSKLIVPELELDKEEVKRLSDAIKEVAKHYNIPVSEKTLALANLASCAGGIYGPRVIAAYARSKKPKPPVIDIPKPTPASTPAPPKIPVPQTNYTAAPSIHQNSSASETSRHENGKDRPKILDFKMREGQPLEGITPSQLYNQQIILDDPLY